MHKMYFFHSSDLFPEWFAIEKHWRLLSLSAAMELFNSHWTSRAKRELMLEIQGRALTANSQAGLEEGGWRGLCQKALNTALSAKHKRMLRLSRPQTSGLNRGWHSGRGKKYRIFLTICRILCQIYGFPYLVVFFKSPDKHMMVFSPRGYTVCGSNSGKKFCAENFAFYPKAIQRRTWRLSPALYQFFPSPDNCLERRLKTSTM